MKISIYSSNRPDVCGEWEKEDVERELRELGVEGFDWIDWVLEHALVDLDVDLAALRRLLEWSNGWWLGGSVSLTDPKYGHSLMVSMHFGENDRQRAAQ